MRTGRSLELPYLGATICVDIVDDVLILMHSAASPTEREWSDYIATAVAARRTSPDGVLALVVTRGGRPDALQRACCAERAAFARVAVITDSAAIRTIAHYMAMFLPEVETFRDLGEALAFLERPNAEIEACLARFGAWFDASEEAETLAPARGSADAARRC